MSSSLDVPEWLKAHPDLQARDIKLFRGFKPFGSLYYTARPAGSTIPQYMVKVLDPATEESSISERLQNNLSFPNHALPSEIIPSEPRLLITPFIGDLYCVQYRNRPVSFFLDLFHQIIEGVEYLHHLRIAHLDICFDNMLCGLPLDAAIDTRIVEGKLYIIDFHTSRQLALEPGRQPPIVLPPSQVEKPPGVTSLDPYSFDVYASGMLMQQILKSTRLKEPDLPWIPLRYAKWLVGNERRWGSICHCRPTAQRARLVLTILRWLVNTSEFLGGGFAFAQRLITGLCGSEAPFRT